MTRNRVFDGAANGHVLVRGHPVKPMGTSKLSKRPTKWSVVSVSAPSMSQHSRLFFGADVSFHSNAMHAAFQPDRSEPLPGAGYDALRRVSRAIATHHDIKELFRSLADELRPVVNFVFLRGESWSSGTANAGRM